MGLKDWARARLAEPLIKELKKGLTPSALAWALALGMWIGVAPLLGMTILLCALAAWALRLNQAAMQAANLAVYPLQFVFLFPFFKLGCALFGGDLPPLDPGEFMARFSEQPLALADEWLWVGLKAIAAWALLGLPAVPLLFLAFRPLAVRASARFGVGKGPG